MLDSRTIYKYDSNGNEIERSEYDSDESLYWKNTSKYNTKNRIIGSIEYAFQLKFGELQEIFKSETAYEYDEY